jgi:hypothetical protein
MTPKEKATELVKKYVQFKIDGQHRIFGIELSKQCALIAVDEILSIGNIGIVELRSAYMEWWEEVKQELEKL